MAGSVIWSLLVGLALLYVGAESLVRGASRMALRLGVTPLLVGLTVVAFGTSSPELAVSLKGALGGAGDIAIGNVVGSNICNIALILGVSALVRPISIQVQLIRLDVPILIACSTILMLFLANGSLGRLEGFVLVGGIIAYLAFTVLVALRSADSKLAMYQGALRARTSLADPMLVVAGLAALVLGSILFVDGAVAVARGMGVAEVVVGMTLVAGGTSLPELATSVVAAAKGEGDISVGNIVGSNIFNILAILGVVGAVSPLRTTVGMANIGVSLLLALLLLPFMRSGFRLSRPEGAVLVGLYLLYLLWLTS